MKSEYNIIGSPPSFDAARKRLLNFIDIVLLDFKVLSVDKEGNLKTSEDAITEDLADFLDNKSELLSQDLGTSFRFTNQSQRKSDIGVKFGRGYTAINREPICWIEAKRLPTPKRNDRDEREYVFVDKKKFKGNGGMQRFKEGKHAPELSYSIMIGYIQENDSNYWLLKINTWITELANMDSEHWSKDECLQKYSYNKCNRFLSTHKRNSKTDITLYHFWISLKYNPHK